jgi:hypothetical protein
VGNLDALSVGEPLPELPDNLMAATWDDEVYVRSFHLVEAGSEAGEAPAICELLAASWTVDRDGATARRVPLRLEAEGREWSVVFSLDESRLFAAGDETELPRVRTAQEEMSLLDYLNASPLHLYTADFARVRGLEIFPAPEVPEFDANCFRPLPWLEEGVALGREFGWTGTAYTRAGFDRKTIHGYFVEYLEKADFPLIFYDHSTGEIADFIAFEETRRGQARRWWEGIEETDAVHVYLFHAKGAGGAAAGNRVGDAYEVCGQVVKSLIWVQRRRDLGEALERRLAGTSFFVRGNLKRAKALLAERMRPVHIHIAVVQPGFTAAGAAPKIMEVLAAADDHVRHAVGTPMFVFSSP